MKVYHLPLPRAMPLDGRVPSQKAICGQALDYKVHTIGLISSLGSLLSNRGERCQKCIERKPLVELAETDLE